MQDESKIFGISVRAFLTLLLTSVVCLMSAMLVKIEEPLYSAFLLALGFFFGQKIGNQQQDGGVK